MSFESPYIGGLKDSARTFIIASVDILGLVLCYLKSSGRHMSLFPMFGVLPSSVEILDGLRNGSSDEGSEGK